MDGMKTSMKTWLIIIVALALLACLILLIRPRTNEAPAATGSYASRGPSFEVHVVKPRAARPLFGIIPLASDELRFDHTSPGAKIVSVRQDRLGLSADGWDLFIETDSEGGVARGTRLVFPIELAGKQRSLRCIPAEEATGYLHTTTRAGSDALDGSFQVELATCENIETGKTLDWPPAPLTLRGSFQGLPQSAQ